MEPLFTELDNLFAGAYPGYLSSDAAYHDLSHTCGATVAAAGLLDGHIKGASQPTITAREFELGIAAILLHDSGYIKQLGDNEGTGAKYLLTHVQRSTDFAQKLLPSLGVSGAEMKVIQSAIQCTDVRIRVSQKTFPSPTAKYIGCMVATADILSQMAAKDYPERLRELYKEYVEAAAYSATEETGMTIFRSAEDLLGGTREFYEGHVQRLLNEELGGVYRDLDHHFGSGNNLYLDAIEANLQRIDRLVAAR